MRIGRLPRAIEPCAARRRILQGQTSQDEPRVTDLPTDIERVLAIGRKRGSLTVAELNRLLPVERMAPEEIARVIARIEEAGIAVEVDDEELTKPAPGQPSREMPGGVDLGPQPPDRAVPAARSVSAPLAGGGAAAPPPARMPRWPFMLVALAIAIAVAFSMLHHPGVIGR
jgi:hypothetical protein